MPPDWRSRVSANYANWPGLGHFGQAVQVAELARAERLVVEVLQGMRLCGDSLAVKVLFQPGFG